MRPCTVATFALLLAVRCAAQGDATAPGFRDVLPIVDAETLDVVSYESLIRAGAAAVPALVAAYTTANGDEAVRVRRQERALRALRAIGPAAEDAGPALVTHLATADRDDVPEILRVLAETAALGTDPERLLGDATRAFSPFVTPGDPGFIHRLKGAIRLHVRMTRPLPRDEPELLVQALEDDDPYVRELAAEWLGRMGAGARGALDALERTAMSSDHPKQARLPNHSLGTDFAPMIRDAAAIAIARIAPDSQRAIPGLRKLLGADDPRERIEAAMALGRLDAKDAERELTAALADDDLRLVAEAVTALGMIEASSPRTIGAVRELADHANAGIAARARATLRRAGIEVPKRQPR